MKTLVLYGVNCTVDVWNPLKEHLTNKDIDYVSYPHSVTETANTIEDISRWIDQTYDKQEYDTIIGHNMAGIIALQLTVLFGWNCKKILLVETNLRPAAMFYRNLLFKENISKLGDYVMHMIKQESPYYTESLMKQLQEEFDYTSYVKETSAQVIGIYGDRGVPDYPNRITDLYLDEETIQRMTFHFIPNSCHMLMLENSEQFASVLKKYLD